MYAADAQRNAKAPWVCGPPHRAPALGQSWPRIGIRERCVACRTPVVEVKAPLFVTAAWRVVWQVLLSHIPDQQRLRCDTNLDMLWCALIDHYLGECGCRWCWEMNNTYARVSRCGSACGVSYANPILHLDHQVISSAVAHNETGVARRRGKFNHGCLYQDLLKFRPYLQNPSWTAQRGLSTLEPCWNASQLAPALDIGADRRSPPTGRREVQSVK